MSSLSSLSRSVTTRIMEGYSHPHPRITQFLVSIGGIYTLKFTYHFLRFIRRHLLLQIPTLRHPSTYLESRYGTGSWVVVTGAVDAVSSNIGTAFCYEFAKLNFNLILIDDNIDLLERTSAQIKLKHPTVMTKLIVTNFEQATQPGWIDCIMSELDGLSISVLVNALAIPTETPTDITDGQHNNDEIYRKSLIYNTLPAVLLSSKILPRLADRYVKTGIRGAILTVSYMDNNTLQSWLPGYVTHAATSAFTSTFALLSGIQYQQSVDTMYINPLMIANAEKAAGDSRFIVTPEQCAKSCMVQLRHGIKETNGYWLHCMKQNLTEQLPYNLLYWLWPTISKKIIVT